ncbi:TPA: hypothetical protein NI618_001724 [Pseudomonas aeruginosa]|nr:hypothetical protein [Pseudomonas aeruginosa]MCS7526983.1 hypothetical protein [Pseudomonas aeruginosa]MCS8510329.1 hypothetical protein [Pseudomonas aeruginosa]MCS8541163.1 hypothetical protein [Pseudomonas aeruginosa]MCT0600309.1 hypothetical protein [Pseudomonas aeruginosa]MCV4061320.1 hypothetical protein [Pseudomonas aeruginosa]
MGNERGNCMGCGEELCHLDDDPNGAHNCTCARCRAQDEHDFDAEPGAVFSRSGERIDNKPQRPAMPQNLRSVLESLPQLPQRQDSTAAQLADLRVIANRLGLYDAADAIKTMLGRQ